jgi:UDP-GlcNAc:undecaprenyl-phosphate GlcNAc-1-phosphate transferase
MWSSFAGVAILSVVITRLLIPFSHTVGLLDRPSERKAHRGAIPLVGGISIYLSVVMGAIVFLDLSQSYIRIGIICGLITSLGALDDRYPLPASYRMALQLLAGLAIAVIGLQITTLGNLVGLGDLYLGLFAIPFTAVAISGLCNAYNMVDGIDGLAGGLALIAMLSLLYLTESRAPEHEVATMMYLCIAIIIFLLFNLSLRPTIKIFMGDAGSTFLGCAVAIAMIHFSQSNRNIINPATTLWLTAVPVIDMISTVLRRLGKGKSPFHADRTHLHHLLMRGGQSQRRALISILLFATVLAFTGIFLERVWPQNEAVSFGLWLMMMGLYLKIITNQAPYFAKRFTKVK